MTYNIRDTPKVFTCPIQKMGDYPVHLDWWNLPDKKFFYSFQVSLGYREIVLLSGESMHPGSPDEVFKTLGWKIEQANKMVEFFHLWDFQTLFSKWKIMGVTEKSISVYIGKTELDFEVESGLDVVIKVYPDGRGFFATAPEQKHPFRSCLQSDIRNCVNNITHMAQILNVHSL